jgi:tRNA nucleotidyltransferase (CCA-adding enzyme)
VSAPGAEDLLGRLRSLPGGVELLAVAPRGSFLVGGAVRDLLLGRRPRELDVVVEGEEGSPFGHAAASLAGGLASRLGTLAETNEHERFGTAIVEWEAGRVDVASARREHYASPGALPEVEPAPLVEDLGRRDFTVNALALALDGERSGDLQGAPHALEDLRAGRLRVLHERSFLDDPTRLWRLARYGARLGFAVEEGTARLAAAAVAQGAPGTVSGARVGAELRLALAEPDPLASLAELERLGLLGALHSRLRFEAPLVRRALELLPTVGGGRGGGGSESACAGGRPDLLLLAALTLPLALRADGGVGGHPQPEIAPLLDRLEFPASERDRVAAAAAAVPGLIDELPRAVTPSRLRALALSVPPEGVALSGAVSESAAPAARRWLEEVRHVRLLITGEDLLAAGVPQGPEVGRRLQAALHAKLDGELADGREAELAAALGLP